MMNAFKYSLGIVGRHMLTVEYAVYAFIRKLANQYTGGYWNYLEVSNGGFYIAPTHATSFNVCIDTNGFEGQMSADAAGITACLFALSHLSFQIQHESIASHFHQLFGQVRDFNREELRANSGRGVDPKAIVRKQFRKFQIARGRILGGGQHLVPALAVE
jgi:hypothetical protein